MNSFLIGIIAVFFLFLGYRFYGKLAEKLWSVDPSRKTPAVEFTDNVDYMPAKHWTILFGHHFASIAGAGPIIGPVVAVIAWGWVPAILWIILGSIFMGGVHDFSALMASLRYRGGSIGEVAQTVLSKRAKILFCGFLWLALVLVVAVFCAVTAKTLVNEPRIVLPTFGLIFVAILVGKMLYDWKVNQVTATVVGVGLLVLLFVLGYYFPITLNIKNPLNMWICVLLIYSYIASIAPVNLILQPRDYLSTFILFFGLVFGYAGLILSHPRMHAPAFVSIPGKEGPLWPMMFVSIACGAISGFHSLIASGTTSKQIASEKDARRIAYGSMIVEGVLACLALLAVSAGLYWAADPDKEGIIYPELMKGGDWIGTFAKGFGELVKPIFGSTFGALIATISLNAFVMTTLDTATRINRYITEELLGEGLGLKVFKNRYFSTAVIVISVSYLVFGNWQVIWPIFGASNQLVAALTLLVATVYLFSVKKPVKYTLYPGIFVLLTTVAALIYQIVNFFGRGNVMLGVVGIVLLILAAFMVLEAIRVVGKMKLVARS